MSANNIAIVYRYKYFTGNNYISTLFPRNFYINAFFRTRHFEIPVYPRTQKYIRAKLRDDQGRPRPLIASPWNQGISLHLWLTCQSQKVRMVTGYKRSGEKKPMHVDKAGRIIAPFGMTASLGLGINHFHRSRSQYLLNHQELEQFGNFVDFMIMNEMVCFCQADPLALPMLRIKEFVNQFDFNEEDFKEETLRVAYWRYRQKAEAYPFDVRVTEVEHFRVVLPKRKRATLRSDPLGIG